MTLQDLLSAGAPPVIAILRGIKPDEVVEIGSVLVDVGLRIIEIPLNSPEPLLSIERLRATLPRDVLVGAGTVTSTDAVDQVTAAGGRLIVAPNMSSAVIARAVELGLDVLPGVMTPTEAFAAIDAGARHLKLFPAATAGPSHLKALREVLPADCRIWAVGGTNADNLGEWLSAGATGIAVGGALYRAGFTADVVRKQAQALVEAWRSASSA